MDVPLEVVGRRARGAVLHGRREDARRRRGHAGRLPRRPGREGGDLLFVIDRAAVSRPRSPRREANLERDRARATRGRRERSSATRSSSRRTTSRRSSSSQATANAEALRATSQADEAAVETARLNLAYCRITAPIPGRTGGLLVHPGNIVKANDDSALVVINQVEPDLRHVRGARGASSRTSRSAPRPAPPDGRRALPNGPGRRRPTGELTFIDNAVDTTTGTINLKATFPNRDRALWPGQFANVSLTLAIDEDAVVAPDARRSRPGQSGTYVYVVKPDDDGRGPDRRRAPDLGAVVRDRRRASRPGERVVTDGQLRLAPGAKVAIKTDAAPAPPGAPKSAEAGR